VRKVTASEVRWAISIPALSDDAKDWLSNATNYGLAVGWLIEQAAGKDLSHTVKKEKSDKANRWTVSVRSLSFKAQLWLRESANYGDTVSFLIESAAAQNTVLPANVTQQKNIHTEILELIDRGMARKAVAAELGVTYAYVCMIILRREKARKAANKAVAV
jgi:hypothetical protein